jgi:hypothetical protein
VACLVVGRVLLVTVRDTERVKDKLFVTDFVAGLVEGMGDLVRVAGLVEGREDLETLLVPARVVGMGDLVTVLDTERVKEVDLVTLLVAGLVVGIGDLVRVAGLVVGSGDLDTVLVTERVRDTVIVGVAGRVVALGQGEGEKVGERVRDSEVVVHREWSGEAVLDAMRVVGAGERVPVMGPERELEGVFVRVAGRLVAKGHRVGDRDRVREEVTQALGVVTLE